MIQIDAHRIEVLLSERHSPRDGRWVLMFQLGNGTGFRVDRHIDAFAMGVWPSEGNYRYAYEIKVSRNDFLRELKDPAKRRWAMEVSHEFSFVAPSGVIVKEEVPDACGLIEVTKAGDKLRTVKVAPHREPRDLNASEISGMLRNVTAKKAFDTLRWKFAGKSMTRDELEELIRQERSGVEIADLEKRAEEKAQQRMGEIKQACELYSEALRKAGVEPPNWMVRPRVYFTPWDATEWVRRNVKPGPAQAAVQDVKIAISQVAGSLSNAEKALVRLSEGP